MIRHLSVSNYRSFGPNVEVPLHAFTVLVGPNGSGKSNLIDALCFVRDSMHMGLSGAVSHRGGIEAVRRYSSGRPFNVSLRIDVDFPNVPNGRGSYGFELTGDRQEEFRVKSEEASVTLDSKPSSFRVENGHWSGPPGLQPKIENTSLAIQTVAGDERFKILCDFLKNITAYAIYPDALRRPQKYNPAKPMDRRGENWISILKDQPEETWKPEIVDALRRLTGDIEDIKVSKAAGYLVVQFRHGVNSRCQWFDALQESDGTLRVAGILTALLQQPPAPVVAIEEPELTVHPGTLPLLLDFLREASQRSQVIVSTHSPELLDLVGAEEVRVIDRVTGVTRVGAIEEQQRDAVRKGLMKLGELMVTEGIRQQEIDFAGE